MWRNLGPVPFGWLVFGIAALVLLYRLGDPPGQAWGQGEPVYVHDECYQAFTAHRYALGDPQAWNPRAPSQAMVGFRHDDVNRWTTYEWVHPPTAKLIMAAFIRAFGFKPVAYRLGGVLFGLLTLFATWRLAARMRGEAFGLFVLVLVAADGLVFVMSRVAMNDIYVTGCVVPAMYALYRYWTDERSPSGWLVAGGTLFGVAITMKWNAAPLLLGCMLLMLGRIVHGGLNGTIAGSTLRRNIAAWLLGFVVLPPLLYMLSYAPYFRMGHGWHDFVALNREIWWYHHALKAVHARGSSWLTWPLMKRPVWFFLQRPTPDTAQVIYAMGNPFLWWPFLPCLAYVAWRFARRQEAADGVILCGFYGIWLPWAFVGRVAFLQYLLPAVPFGALAVATTLDDLRRRLSSRGRWLLPAYALLCVAAFAHFYPILSAVPVSNESLNGRRWFWVNSWR